MKCRGTFVILGCGVLKHEEISSWRGARRAVEKLKINNALCITVLCQLFFLSTDFLCSAFKFPRSSEGFYLIKDKEFIGLYLDLGLLNVCVWVFKILYISVPRQTYYRLNLGLHYTISALSRDLPVTDIYSAQSGEELQFIVRAQAHTLLDSTSGFTSSETSK